MYLSEVYGRGGIYAKVVAASIANGIPIYTIETKAPKFIDAEFEKHRMLSTNSSSSRAIPTKTLLKIVKKSPWVPFDWRKNRAGMQGYEIHAEEVSGPYTVGTPEEIWEEFAAGDAYNYAKAFSDAGYHKQTVNRLLEPFLFQLKVATATEWDNFFNLRLAPDAQPEIQELARCMKEAMEAVEPVELKPGEWHLPYGNTVEYNISVEDAIKCSVARCARVSYMNHDNTYPDADKDLALYYMLLESKHLTPFEHQATPMPQPKKLDGHGYPLRENVWGDWRSYSGITHEDKNRNLWSGNFRGWIQYRQLVSEWNE